MTGNASNNFEALSRNPYPGRGIIIGMAETGEHVIQVYWIMGRSENSRNRIFSVDGSNEYGHRVFTEAADPAKVQDPSLIIYNAMRQTGSHCVITNGDQTDAIIHGLDYQRSASEILKTIQYEPDSPNYTPRICGVCILGPGTLSFNLAILRKSLWGNACDRTFYHYDEIAPGFGFCVTTYSGDGNPLPSFTGDPLLMPLTGSVELIAENYWAALNKENRVSLAVKFINVVTGKSTIHIINKFQKVE